MKRMLASESNISYQDVVIGADITALRSWLDQSEGQECRPECGKRGGMTHTSNSGHLLSESVVLCKPGKREF